MNPPPEIRFLVQAIEEGYSKKAWHGPNLRGSVRGLTPEGASWRPGKGRHNIWEIAVHCAYWKYAVRRRILGEKRGSFPLAGSNWFRRPGGPEGDSWKRDLGLLDDMHRLMVGAILRLGRGELDKIPRGSTVSNRSIIRGIAAHDVYHAGQIQLIKKLCRAAAGG